MRFILFIVCLLLINSCTKKEVEDTEKIIVDGVELAEEVVTTTENHG